MEHSQITVFSKNNLTSIVGGWKINCPICLRLITSGSNDNKPPIKTWCSGVEPKKLSIKKAKN